MRHCVNTRRYGLNSLSYFAPKVWDMIFLEIKNTNSLQKFKTKITKSAREKYSCYLCRSYVQNLRFVELVDENLHIPGCSIARIDHSSNIKCSGVCVYYKTSLPLKLLNIKYLQERINLGLIIGYNLCSFIILYRSPSQTHGNFENFTKNSELNFDEIKKKIIF